MEQPTLKNAAKFLDDCIDQAQSQSLKVAIDDNPEFLINSSELSNMQFTGSGKSMLSISHSIEKQALNLKQPFRFYGGFQNMSRFSPQTQLYQAISEKARQVYVFGLLDVALPPPHLPHQPNEKLVVVPLGKTPESLAQYQASLSRFWFVILHNPHFISSALVCREVPLEAGFQRQKWSKLLSRQFEGFWTFEKSVIEKVTQCLDDYVQDVSERI